MNMLEPIVIGCQELIITTGRATIGSMKKSPKEMFAERLNELCADRGIEAEGSARQRVLAKDFGVSYQAARKWLDGLSMPELEKCIQVAAWGDVAFEWLMTGRGYKRPEALSVQEPRAAYDVQPPKDEQLEQLIKDYHFMPPGWRYHLARKAATLRKIAEPIPEWMRETMQPISDTSHYWKLEKQLQEEEMRIDNIIEDDGYIGPERRAEKRS